jgi:hypothetical protein
MTRTGPGFVIGFLVGGLGGFAAGYLLSRDGNGIGEATVGSIDLTPTIELKERQPNMAPDDVAEAPRETSA